MASGSFNLTRTGGSTYLTFRVYWESISKGSAVNGSLVNVYVYVSKSSSSNASTSGTVNTTVNVDSWSQSENGLKFNVDPGKELLIFAKAYDYVGHESDGSKSVTISVSVGGNIMSASGSSVALLDRIPRTSSVSATSATIGHNCAISISKASSDFTHTLLWSFGNLTGTIASYTYDTTISWTVPDDLYTQIPNATYGTGAITCYTYSGNSHIGTSTCSFYAYVDENVCKPTLNPSAIDKSLVAEKLINDNDKMLRYLNSMHVIFNSTANNSASIVSMSVKNGSKILDSDGTFDNATSTVFDFSVTDSRGYTTTKRIRKDEIPYKYVRLTADETTNIINDSNGYIVVKITGNFYNGLIGTTQNNINLWYRYKIGSNNYGDWIAIDSESIVFDGDNFSSEVDLEPMNINDTIIYQIRAIDTALDLYPSSDKQYTYSPEISCSLSPVFDWSSSDFNFNVPVHSTEGYTYDTASQSKCSVMDPKIVLESRVFYVNNASSILLGYINEIAEKFITKYGNAIGVTCAELGVIVSNGDWDAAPIDIVGTYWMIYNGQQSLYARLHDNFTGNIRINIMYIADPRGSV